MTKEEFKQNYCARSGITEEFYNQHFVTLPCNCGDSSCEGWATIGNNSTSITTHNELYR
ncbi:hypothetical protein QGM71_01350 [Virgibacillus sp. C22-A2]|uniref:Post-SET domain-containing protein n=1 Tax=Virgibacillus tibetensis TaxID=3042313 RepID=A0ABU6KAH3_9BACI|nr:hypothetical protein [Virgibacillus sp. C22-A2]